MKKFNQEKYKWRGFNPRAKKWFFRWKPQYITGANFRELNFLWWKFAISWPYYSGDIWQDGWDACFRDNLYKDEIIESTKVSNRKN